MNNMSNLLRFLRGLTVWILFRPRLVLGIALGSAVLCIALTVAKLDMQTDQLELISPNHPLIRLTDRLDPFKVKESFTVVVEAPEPRTAVLFAEEMARRIEADKKNFKSLSYRVDPNMLMHWGLLYLGQDDLLKLRKELVNHEELIDGLARSPEILTFMDLVNKEMTSHMVGELFTGFLKTEDKTGRDEKPMDLRFLTRTLESLSSYLDGTPRYESPWAVFFSGWDLEMESYFWESGKRFLIMLVTPNKIPGQMEETLPPLQELRKIIGEVRASHPEVRAGVTGQRAINLDEMATAMKDMAWATWLSVLGVWVLMILFFRSLRRTFLELTALGIGLSWTFGWTTLVIGHLNILSLVFAPMLCGLGMDYGIHWLTRYEEEERDPTLTRKDIIVRVVERSGPGVLHAGLATAFAFFPFMLTGFVGLSELGAISGTGILFVVLADFTVLPALIFLMGGTRTGLPSRSGETWSLPDNADQTPFPEKPKSGKPRHQWVPAFAGVTINEKIPGQSPAARRIAKTDATGATRDMLRFNRRSGGWILLAMLLLCGLGLWEALRVGFDINPLRLQSKNAESVIWEQKLVQSASHSTLTACVLAHSLDEAIRKSKALEALPSVLETENILSVLPKNQENKIELLRKILVEIPEIRMEDSGASPLDADRLTDVLARIGFKMQEDRAAEWGADEQFLEQMRTVDKLIVGIVKKLQSDGAAAQQLEEFRKRFTRDLVETVSFIRSGASADSMRIEDIPQSIREHLCANGVYLILVYPRNSIWNEKALTEFVKEVQSVDPEAVGDPISLYVFATAYREACLRATLYSIAAIIVMLVAPFRSAALILLALVPLVVGAIWTIGIMGASGIDFNLANSIFLPLVFGAGIEYAVIILHRWREGTVAPGHLPVSTGKGVILAALTTTAGFGTLMISTHRGIFSLGFVAWTGSLCILAAAVILLPAFLAFMKPPKCGRPSEGDEKQ